MKKYIFSILLSTLLLSALPTSAQVANEGGSSTSTSSTVYCPALSQDLKRGMRDRNTVPPGQVSELQRFISTYYAVAEADIVTGYFGYTTKRYVVRFQEEHASEILAPFGLTEGTGYVGELTRTVMRRVAGCTIQTTVAVAAPILSSITPTNTTAGQSVTLTITGSNFASGAVLQYPAAAGGTATISLTFVSSTQLSTVLSSGLAAGTYDFKVKNPDGQVSVASVTVTATVATSAAPQIVWSGKVNVAGTWYDGALYKIQSKLGIRPTGIDKTLALVIRAPNPTGAVIVEVVGGRNGGVSSSFTASGPEHFVVNNKNMLNSGTNVVFAEYRGSLNPGGPESWTAPAADDASVFNPPLPRYGDLIPGYDTFEGSEWGHGDEDDVVAVVQFVKDGGVGIIDSARFYVIGASHGGYLALAAASRISGITRTIVHHSGIDALAFSDWYRTPPTVPYPDFYPETPSSLLEPATEGVESYLQKIFQQAGGETEWNTVRPDCRYYSQAPLSAQILFVSNLDDYIAPPQFSRSYVRRWASPYPNVRLFEFAMKDIGGSGSVHGPLSVFEPYFEQYLLQGTIPSQFSGPISANLNIKIINSVTGSPVAGAAVTFSEGYSHCVPPFQMSGASNTLGIVAFSSVVGGHSRVAVSAPGYVSSTTAYYLSRGSNDFTATPIQLVPIATTQPAPVLSAITPTTTTALQPVTFTITGANFAPGAVAEYFTTTGNTATTALAFISSTQLSAQFLSGVVAGTYDVRIRNLDGQASSNVVKITATISPPTLSASCNIALGLTYQTGQYVTRTAASSGGTGSYAYSWSGTDGLSGTTQSVTKSYSTTGTKSAQVLITSGTQSVTALCNDVTVNAPVTPLPTATTGSAGSITTNGATLNGTVNASGALSGSAWFRYGVSGASSSCSALPNTTGFASISGTANTPIAQTLTGLVTGAKYDFCAVANTPAGAAYGSVVSFTTATIPTVATLNPTRVTDSSATMNGSANPNGTAATGWFRGATASPGSCNDTFGTRFPSSGGTALGSGTSATPYSYVATGLQPSTKYYYCAIASNSSGNKNYGTVVSVTTGPPVAIISAPSTNQTNVQGTLTTFSGSATPPTGNSVTAYEWRAGSCTAGTFLSGTPSFSIAGAPGAYTVYFRAKDNTGAWSPCASRNMTITALSTAPQYALYQLFFNNSSTASVSTDSISHAAALDSCLSNAAGNPTKSVICKWSGVTMYTRGSYTVAMGNMGGFAQTASVINAFSQTPTMDSVAAEEPGSKFSYIFTEDLYHGMQGNDVKALQQALVADGEYRYEITGNFYDITYDAVIAFQKKYGINPTGYVGPVTREKLNELF